MRERFAEIARKYSALRMAVVGDFCLDRYLEIDPAREEVSIETGLPVHNVVRVRSQPGGAGTILNNLVALGVGRLHAVGFCGEDGEGFELKRSLASKPGVSLDAFLTTPSRRTFTYCKPLVVEPGRPPVELNRLDSKNWEVTPAEVSIVLSRLILELGPGLDAVILLSQVDRPETGAVTRSVLDAVDRLARTRPDLLILADSRQGLRDYPPVCFKMNRAELAAMTGAARHLTREETGREASKLAKRQGRAVFITLSEGGILGAAPDGSIEHVPAIPVRGEIDIVGAGDAVTANLTAALAAGATLREALLIANAAASIVVHQLGTTGTATIDRIQDLLAH